MPAVMDELFDHLIPQGYEVFVTPDPRGTIRQAYDLRPDVALMVVDDPQADVWASPLQTLRSLSSIPIVALVNSEADCAAALAHGASACVTPPFDGLRIVAMVDDLTRWRDAKARVV